LAFAIGANLSKGGRNITALPSTAKGGKVSRIVPIFEPGTVVTIPRNLADIVVSEYGIAKLRGKTQRLRAQELIAIAHPDFRNDLSKDAKKLFWP
jgi:acyl-CoA hydrolase